MIIKMGEECWYGKNIMVLQPTSPVIKDEVLKKLVGTKKLLKKFCQHIKKIIFYLLTFMCI